MNTHDGQAIACPSFILHKDVIQLKKTQTKAFTNLVASIMLLVFEIWAYAQTLGFKVIKKAAVQPATFPQFMCIGMIIFTVILLIQSIVKLQKNHVRLIYNQACIFSVV